MSNHSKNKTKRIRNLVITTVLTAVLLSVSTYAWFIGIRTVNVESFDVQIASTDSLLLSLDGKTWDTTVRITEDTIDDVSYLNHTNSWGGRGLIPMSSVGEMDSSASRMKLFEKASLTATGGGYRLLSSRVDNNGAGKTEQEGYVAFDLFIKNITGAQYIKELNVLDEEAIYLTNDSEVTVAETGVKNTGIENSVRVAFTQVGRVAGTTTDEALITGITCAPGAESAVTGICRDAQIWEPNDTNHVANAISWYNTTCKKRNAADLTLKESFAGACGQVIDGVAYPTYSVTKDIKSSDRVDVYDGAAYNSYAASTTVAEGSSDKPLLQAFPAFTDTDKMKAGTERPEFITLAPNSITKVRIYIYIEGQDIDNYDFASIGKKISVKFGFTKERLTEDDFNYEGPDVNQGEGPEGADRTAPVITLNDEQVMTVTKGAEFVDPGAKATDNKDAASDSTEEDKLVVVTSGTVNTDVAGTYRIVYHAIDKAGNKGAKTRTVIVTE